MLEFGGIIGMPLMTEGVMAAGKWSDLPVRTRQLIVAGAAAEGVLKAAALIDLKRTPKSQIRGAKWIWASAVLLINSAGGAPLAYFAFGRRTPPHVLRQLPPRRMLLRLTGCAASSACHRHE